MRRVRRLWIGAAMGAGMLVTMSPALAQTYTGVQPPGLGAVLPTGVQAGLGVAATGPVGQVLASQVSAPAPAVSTAPAQGSRLAVTGSDVRSMALVAVPMIAAGVVITRRARPKQAR